jgi:serine/threonine protein kinase
VVVRCRKISTGKVYAMKVQRKIDLAGVYREDPRRVDLEVRVLASLHHRFLTGMDYSFQTEHFGMIAMELAEGGTLLSVAKVFGGNRIPERALRFYIAELVDALHHIHSIGLIYRDVKEENVLLDGRGHIKLADLGGVVDTTRGETITAVSGKSNAMFPFAPKFGSHIPYASDEHLTNPRRQLSVMGTPGYMAPEVVALFDRKAAPGIGYCYMVDWWSVGVTMYILSTDKFPFECEATDYAGHVAPLHFPEDFPYSPELVSLTKGFLEVQESQRLGYGLNGFRDIRNQEFFSGMDWARVAAGSLPAPLLPGVDFPAPATGHEKYTDFDSLVKQTLEKDIGYLDALSDRKQQWFKNW